MAAYPGLRPPRRTCPGLTSMTPSGSRIVEQPAKVIFIGITKVIFIGNSGPKDHGTLWMTAESVGDPTFTTKTRTP